VPAAIQPALAALQGVFVLGFVLASMLAIGMTLRPRRILEPARDPWLLAGTLVAGFVVVPATALLLGSVLNLDEDLRIGLVLMACAHGGPFLPKLASLARANLALAVALMGIQLLVTVVSLPIVVPLLLPGASADARAIAAPLLVQLALPLAIGLVVGGRWPALAARLRGPLLRLSNACFVLLFLVLIALDGPSVVRLAATGAMFAVVALLAVGAVAGFALGGRTRSSRTVVAIASALPGMSAAFVVANGSFADRPMVLLFLAAATLLGLVIVVPVALAVGRSGGGEAATDSVLGPMRGAQG
jgi:BASS family bile acid:Na+ symporter